jgi:predicted RNA-binding protein with PUA domain
VNDDVMNSHNPLLVVNNKVYLNRPPIEKADKVVVIEGNTEVTNVALQKR